MNKIVLRKLILKLFVLFVMVSGITFLLSDNAQASTATCWERYMWCLEDCDRIFNPVDPPSPTCYEVCDHNYANCV